MKKTLLAFCLGAVCLGHASDLKTDSEKIAYTIGFGIGNNIATNPPESFNLDNNIVLQGIKDGLAKKTSKVREEESQKLMSDFSKKEQELYEQKHKEKRKALSVKNKAVGKKLLEENRKKKGVKVTTSGLQYEVLKKGEGEKPNKNSKVKVHYKGTLPNGDEFDSSYTRGEPAEFPLSAVIPGWVEGLQLMSKGSKYRFIIPSNLAYGEDAPQSIGPDQVLTFEVELLDIKK